ncbi:MAG TPA: hypothetical protein VFL04_01660 [Rectinemataceae bacterium]|nr:hypothetical protein [Rectinemataceae bacterium]
MAYDTQTVDEMIRIGRDRGLADGLCEELVGDFLRVTAETCREYVLRRHRELQAENLKNVDIFPIIQAEIAQRRFAAPPHSERQIRRLIYG